jgi:RNA polymerase sigma factor (sigma-70 family)
LAVFAIQRRFTDEVKTEDTRTLLAEFVGKGSESAFKEIVQRFVNLVYGTARRCVGGDGHLAEDVTQTVFTHLAQKAPILPGDVQLGGWLHRDTCHVAATLVRGERRRQSRERQAMETNSLEDHTRANLAQLTPVLDEAINELEPVDRQVILLRFFEQRDFRSVGEAIGSSENAAQKRVSRALEELRALLKHRGLTLSMTALVAGLSTESMAVAPTGLAAIATSAALANVSAGSGLVSITVKALPATKFSVVAMSALLIASIAVPVFIQLKFQARLREADQRLRLQSEELAKAMANIQALSNLLDQREKTKPVGSAQLSELLRLRGAVGRLRNEEREITQPSSTTATNDDLTSKEALWARRLDHLKQWLLANPGESIPELKLLSDRDWLDSIGGLTVDGPEEYRRALSLVRGNAEIKVMGQLGVALRRCASANKGQIATDLSELTPYLDSTFDQSLLSRYEIVPSTQLVSQLQKYGDWVITQKSAVNEALDARFAEGLNSGGFADERITNRWAVGP